jgi:hypothetical protein
MSQSTSQIAPVFKKRLGPQKKSVVRFGLRQWGFLTNDCPQIGCVSVGTVFAAAF